MPGGPRGLDAREARPLMRTWHHQGAALDTVGAGEAAEPAWPQRRRRQRPRDARPRAAGPRAWAPCAPPYGMRAAAGHHRWLAGARGARAAMMAWLGREEEGL